MPDKPLQHCGIVITRPRQQAQALAKMVNEAGGEALLYPLLEIVGLDEYSAFDAIVAELDSYDWAIFISSNAVQFGMTRLLSQRALPAKLRWAAIGPTTAKELQAYGIKQVLTPSERFDSESLLKMAEMRSVNGLRIVIFRGAGGREVLAGKLAKRGAEVVFAECYRREMPTLDVTKMHGLWQNGRLHAIVVTSSEALRYLAVYVKKNSWLTGVPLFVNHARIAEKAAEHGLQATLAQDIGDKGMLQALIAWRGNHGKL